MRTLTLTIGTTVFALEDDTKTLEAFMLLSKGNELCLEFIDGDYKRIHKKDNTLSLQYEDVVEDMPESE